MEQITREENGVPRPTVQKYSKAQKRMVAIPKYVPPSSMWKDEIIKLNRHTYTTKKDEMVAKRLNLHEADEEEQEDDKSDEEETRVRKWTFVGDPNLDVSDSEDSDEIHMMDSIIEKKSKKIVSWDKKERKRVIKINKSDLKVFVDGMGLEELDSTELVDESTGELLVPNAYTI